MCTNELIVLHFLGIYIRRFFFFLHRDSNSRPNFRRFRGYQLNHRGDRHAYLKRLGGDYLSMRLNCVHLRERTANMETTTMLASLSSSSEL